MTGDAVLMAENPSFGLLCQTSTDLNASLLA